MTADAGAEPVFDLARSPRRDLAVRTTPTPRIVGIGASAGGLQAFTDFVGHMPPDSGLAFVLVQHLDPQQPSLLPELLAAHTPMPVRPATDQTPVAPDHIYLIPPNTALTVTRGVLHLEPPTEAHGLRLPIDHFFRSLAADQGARATGIVLSGTGADGTLGLAAIRARGGLTLAQTPDSASSPEMPQRAIAKGVVDYVLDVAAMPALLIATDSLPPAPRGLPALPSGMPLALVAAADTIRAITTVIQQATGHDFSHYKHATLLRRIDRRIQMLGLPSREAYHARLLQDRPEVDLLFKDLLISVTEFFRDPEAFEALVATVVPELLRNKEAGAPLRIWVPGCASGEEAYSIAILIHEQLAQLAAPPPVQVFATDIDEVALTVARRGTYSASVVAPARHGQRAQYFVQDGQSYQVIKAIRELCLFSVHNLISDPPFGRMDLIACRNLLIYFDADLQRQLLPVLHYALARGGYLFLGSAESATGGVGTPDLFRVVDAPHRIYQRKEWLARTLGAQPWATAGGPMPQLASAAQRPLFPGTRDVGATVDRLLLRSYAPVAAAIDARGTVAYLSGRAHPYFSIPAGTPTRNLLAMAHSDLRLPLRAAIRAATTKRVPVVREDLTIATAEGRQHILLTVRPLAELGSDSELLLVIVQTVGPPITLAQLASAPDPHAEPNNVLAQELMRTREMHEATIRELQETNYDQTAVNEELRSLNEELQVTNEEFQTSKEEIQSINEELQTVNAELSRKIEELDRVNADLANLFASTQIPAIFLRGDGRIARFTPRATELFALIDIDIGRPISDLNARFSDRDLHVLIAQVLRTLIPVELVVQQPDPERWWSLHIRPYRTLTDVIDGVVLTFADITALKRAEAVLQESHDVLEQRVEARTQDLALANTALQAQVAERVRSEQSREQLLQQLVTAQEEERRHIARELHDQMGQDLTALILGLKVLQNEVADDVPITGHVAQLQDMAVRIGHEVRSLAVQLRPSVLDDLGLILAIRNYVEQWSAQAHVAADLHSSGLDSGRLPLAVETAIYRLVQEALTNVLKHASASEISVIIERHTDEVRLIVEDDGTGFTLSDEPRASDAVPHLGLLGMQERVTLLGGTLMIETAPRSGTTIFARIPLPQA